MSISPAKTLKHKPSATHVAPPHPAPRARLEHAAAAPRPRAHLLTCSRAYVLTCLALVAGGLASRSLDRWLYGRLGATVPLRQPLSTLPLAIGPWQGQDEPLSAEVQRIAGEDAYLNRRYVDPAGGRAISLYVGYVGGLRKRLSHRPDICYHAHGFEQVSEQPVDFAHTPTPPHSETPFPAVLYEFAAPNGAGESVLVLATYLLNGRYTNDKKVFNNFNARGPSLFGRRAAYAARVQLSMRATPDRAADLAVLQSFATGVLGPIRAMMPDAGFTAEHAEVAETDAKR